MKGRPKGVDETYQIRCEKIIISQIAVLLQTGVPISCLVVCLNGVTFVPIRDSTLYMQDRGLYKD